MLLDNLLYLRKIKGFSQEKVAEAVGVTRQAVANWERGETQPDIQSCTRLAELYGISLDALVSGSPAGSAIPLPPRGKHMFGVVRVGDKGQMVIPKKAREVFDIKSGDELIMLGDESQGLALLKAEDFMELVNRINSELGGTKK